MRLWSIHPMYLDSKGLVALWRESLLAKKVLEGKTKGYKNHPQLERFKGTEDPVKSIQAYMQWVYFESIRRGFNFKKDELNYVYSLGVLPVTEGQLRYERDHLLSKLRKRESSRPGLLEFRWLLKPHPLFYVINGEIEKWERMKRE